MAESLEALYRAHAKGHHALTDEDLRSGLAACRVMHPRVVVDDAAFIVHVAEREGLKEAALSDLFLAFACGHGDANALASIESLFSELLRTRNVAEFDRDDALSALRRDLFVGDAPRILQFTGQGPLRAWLRVAATRAFVKVKRGQKNESNDDALLAERAPGADPELHYLKAKYRDAFRAAVEDAITSLEPKSALLLKQSIVDGLSIDELASLHASHRATCARWVAQAKDELLKSVRQHFGERAHVQGEELESVLRLIESNFDVSMKRHLVRASGDE